MGFYSWKTCDTEQSVAVAATGRVKPVYLLQPNGQAPIEEPCYEGYGQFGGVFAYAWLAKINGPKLGINVDSASEETLHNMGIALELGTAYRDKETGELWSVYHDHGGLIKSNVFAGTYADPIPGIGQTPNQLIESGRFETIPIRELVDLAYPIKLSYNPEARYEDWPESKNCPHQGYFFDEGEDDEMEFSGPSL